MKGIRVVFFFVAAAALLATLAEAQECPEGVIPNFRVEEARPTSYTLSWNHPSGFGPETSYELINLYAATHCAWVAGRTRRDLVATVFEPSHTVRFDPPEATECYYVRLAGCETLRSEFCIPAWNYSSPSLKPNLISALVSGPAQVTITYSHPDERTPVRLQRAASDGIFRNLELVPHCPPGSTQSFTDYGPGGSASAGGKLSPGTYQYRLVGLTQSAATPSDVKSVVVGGGVCIPPQVAPQLSAVSTNVSVDSRVTINWSTTEAVERFLIEIARDGFFTTVTHAFRVPGFARSATFVFPVAGTYVLRLFAENSCGRKEATPRLTFTVAPPPPRVVLTAKPSGMFQVVGETDPVTDSYTLTNLGAATTIQLMQTGSFFTQSPTEFTLIPGASQLVTLTVVAQAAIGPYLGTSTPLGTGVPAGLVIPVRLLVASRPTGDPDARPETIRVDLAAPEGATPIGSIRFTNKGNGSIRGLLVSDAPWIIPVDEFVTIAPGETGTFTFQIDRSQRPRGRGSAIGALSLVYLRGSSAKLALSRRPSGSEPPAGSKTTLVTVSDTVTPTVTATAIPPLAGGEIAFFVPGVGHLQGNVGLFVSDVSILNTGSIEDLEDLKMYFTPGGGSGTNAQLTSFSELSANQSLSLADVTKSVFNSEGSVGSLQIRASNLSALSINANIFNTSSALGTYGTSIPVFRSDRALGAQEKLYLTGLRKDSSGYTNLYVQEMAGQTASVQIDFIDTAGNQLGSIPASVQPFALAQILNPLPEGAVAVVLTNTSANGARVLAHATPVDQLTGDTWSIADWARQHGYSMSEPVTIPVAGKLRGLNNSDFRTDVAIMNAGSSTASGTLTYYQTGSQPIDRVLTLAPMESRILPDVVGSLYEINTTSVGYLVFTPANGSFAVTSRTYTLEADQRSSYGTGVPTLSVGSSLKPGEVRKIAGIEDATQSTATAGKPGTYRTNFGLAETAGQPVTVRATIRYTAVQGAAAAVGISSADFALQPRQFLLVSSITSAILGPSRALFGELRDIQVDFAVVEGSGGGNAVVFTTSTDNGTNDTALRTE